MTAALVDAHLLVLLTDVAGVYREDPANAPAAEPVAFARGVDELREFCYRKTAAESIGGMVTKLDAAEKAGRYGIPTVIASGSDPSALTTVLAGGRVGTLIAADPKPLRARKHWMSVQSRLPGSLVVDDGAVRAIQKSASLLPSGVVEVRGRFRSGDLVSVVDQTGTERARGIVRFDDRDVERIRGLHSTEVDRVLDRRAGNVVMRTDRMFVFQRSEDR
jgi:glutamate 5-kinase